MINAQIPEQ
jgi:hypothetical protein